MADIIIAVIPMIPMYGLLIWIYLYPEESILKRWMDHEEREVSKSTIRYIKFASAFTMVGLPVVCVSFIFEIPFLRLFLVAFPIVYIIGAIKVLSDE